MDRVTLAARLICLELKETAVTGLTTNPVRLQTKECAFLSPFVGAKAGVFLAQGRALNQGQLIWQGSSDVLDHRLHYIMASDKGLPETQQKPNELVEKTWSVWRYPVKEARPPILTIPLARTFEDRKPWALDRLVLPGPKSSSPLTIDQRAGADMHLLGYPPPPKRP
jgi:hypothetical protein